MSPVTRPESLPPPPPQTRSFVGLVTGDEWTPPAPFSLWRANKITVNVAAAPAYVRLSRTQPPEPPVWDNPIYLVLGPWSHVGAFGYWQFKSANRGKPAAITGTAYAE